MGSTTFRCSGCGAHHTGTWSRDYCPDCAKKRGQTGPE